MSDTGKLWIELEKEFPKEYKEWFKEERKFLKEVITPNSEVLEVGCGDGRSIIDLLQITDNI